MTSRSLKTRNRKVALVTGVVMLAGLAAGATLWGQTRLTEPVYRVASEPASQPTAAQPVSSPHATAVAAAATPFDVAQRPGEHPLMPLIRACKTSLEYLDKNVRDYSCTFIKRERLDGELGEPQNILMKVRHEPFSVYMSFIKPYAGREVLYVAGQNDNELIVREAGGIKGLLGKMNLDPEGNLAMDGQKYPITKVGMRNLLLEITATAEADLKFAESNVTVDPQAKFNERPATLIQVVHRVPRQNFRAHWTRVYFDNELRLPIYYDAYLWPENPGEQPPLDESYIYHNLKLNNGYTARDFNAENGEIFK